VVVYCNSSCMFHIDKIILQFDIMSNVYRVKVRVRGCREGWREVDRRVNVVYKVKQLLIVKNKLNYLFLRNW